MISTAVENLLITALTMCILSMDTLFIYAYTLLAFYATLLLLDIHIRRKY